MGNGGLGREDREKASHVFKGPAASYSLGRREIYSKGLMLAIPDEVMKASKVGTILFRVWWKGELVLVPEERSSRKKRDFNGKEREQKARKIGEAKIEEVSTIFS